MTYFRGDAGGRPDGQGLGQPPMSLVPGLPSFQMPADVRTLLGPLPAATYTPWAAQESDTSWVELPSPGSDVLVAELGPALTLMSSIGLGLPGYVAFLTDRPVPATEAERAFEGTHYALESVLAVYREDDARQPPRAQFLYWGRLQDAVASPEALDPQRLASAGGRLVFAQQVGPTEPRRSVPPFHVAAATQFPGLVAAPKDSDGSPPSVQPTPPGGELAEHDGGPGALALFLVGAGAALAGFFGVRALKTRSR